MFGNSGVGGFGDLFKYSVHMVEGTIIRNQALVAWSLKQAIKEAIGFESDLQPNVGICNIKTITIDVIK